MTREIIEEKVQLCGRISQAHLRQSLRRSGIVQFITNSTRSFSLMVADAVEMKGEEIEISNIVTKVKITISELSKLQQRDCLFQAD